MHIIKFGNCCVLLRCFYVWAVTEQQQFKVNFGEGAGFKLHSNSCGGSAAMADLKQTYKSWLMTAK